MGHMLDAHIVAAGQLVMITRISFAIAAEHLAQVLRLHLKLCFCLIAGIVRKMQMLQLGSRRPPKGNVRSELFSDLFDRHHGIFHHIVQKSRHDRLLIQLQIRQDNRHAQRMDDVRLAGFTHLSPDGRYLPADTLFQSWKYHPG